MKSAWLYLLSISVSLMLQFSLALFSPGASNYDRIYVLLVTLLSVGGGNSSALDYEYNLFNFNRETVGRVLG